MTDTSETTTVVERYDPFDGALGISIATRVGNLVFVSGTPGVRSDGTVPEDPEEQFRLAFAHLEDTLREMGTSFDHVVDMTSFLCGDLNELYPIFQRVRSELLGGRLPASASVGVAALLGEGLSVEIKMVAALP
jgi:enamine deaminase RidA (YjgF/YER057c/UK114 family)